MQAPMNSQIYIFSRAIRTGKTTALRNWSGGKPNIAGILTPDENGLRKLYDITSGTTYDLQVAETFPGPVINIGRFVFDQSVMEKAKQLLLDACYKNTDWLVIDEVGKLETEQNAGLEPAVTEIIQHYQSGKATGKLLLVIRDSLLDKALEKYVLKGAVIFSDHLP